MSQRHLLALFNSFDEAEAAITELRAADIKGFDIDDLVLESPIEHPEAAALLGDKPVYVQWYTLAGSILGGLLGFFLIAGAQANFFAQMKAGQPIVPLPPNFVLTYLLFILGGILITVLGFLIGAGLPAKRSPLYSAKVSQDQIGVLVKGDERALAALKAVFTKYQALEIQEEAGK